MVPALAGMILQNVLMLGTGVMIARAIGSADYGVSNLLRSLLQFALMLTPLGLDIALQKHVGATDDPARARVDVNRLRLIVVGATVIGVVAIPFGLGTWLNTTFYRVPHFETYLTITFASLPLLTDIAILGGVMRGRHNPNPQVFASYYVLPLFRLALVIAFLQLGWGLVGVLLANTLGSLASFLILNVYFHFVQDRKNKSITPEKRPSWSETAALMEPALWMAMSIFFYSTIRNVDILVLGTARPMKEVGEYGSLSTIAQFAQFFPAALSFTLGPIVARLFAQGDFDGIKDSLSGYLRMSSLFAAPIFAACVAWGPVLDLLFGKTFHYSQFVALLLPLGYFVSGVLGPMGFALSMTGRHRIETLILVSGNLLVVTACLLTARPFGQNGVAASVLAGYLLINLLRFAIVSRTLKVIPGHVRDFVPPLLCLCLAVSIKWIAFALFPRTVVTMVGSGLVFGLAFSAIYWPFLLNQAEKTWLLQRMTLRLR